MGKVKKSEETPVHMSYQPPRILLAGIHLGWVVACATRPWVRMIGQRQPRNWSHHHKTQDCEPCGRAVLLGSLTLLISTQAPLPNKVSCFFSTCVSSDDSFLRVRQEPSLGSWKGSPFLQQFGRKNLIQRLPCQFCINQDYYKTVFTTNSTPGRLVCTIHLNYNCA